MVVKFATKPKAKELLIIMLMMVLTVVVVIHSSSSNLQNLKVDSAVLSTN